MWFSLKIAKDELQKLIDNPLIKPIYLITGKKKLHKCEIIENKINNNDSNIEVNKNRKNKKDKVESEIVLKSMIINNIRDSDEKEKNSLSLEFEEFFPKKDIKYVKIKEHITN